MAINDIQEYAEENIETNETAGKTTFRVSSSLASTLKEQVGVNTNKKLEPIVEAALAEYLGLDDAAADAEQRFKDQFEEE